MGNSFEADGRGVSDRALLLRGVIAALVAAALVALMIAKSNGDLDEKVQVTAVLVDVGDGLPARSDVKFRGVLVGSVADVTPSSDGGPNYVHIDLRPEYARGIPASVTARVVPSNVFAVSSVQLVDNGGGGSLDNGAEIPEDTSKSTIEFQTALNKLREILDAVGRGDSDDTVGTLAALAAATDRRGADIVAAGRQLRRIVDELGPLVAPGDGPSTIDSLNGAVQGLASAAPELVDALHNAVTPLHTIAEKRSELTTFLSGGLTSFGTIATAMNNNTDQLVTITTNLTPVIGVLADNGHQFTPIFIRVKTFVDNALGEAWNAETNTATIKAGLSLTPTRTYTRADCPRYGDLLGPSCFTAPETAPPVELPASLDPRNFTPPAALMGGTIGSVGSLEELEQLRALFGDGATDALQLLVGPLLRGTTVNLFPLPDEAER